MRGARANIVLQHGGTGKAATTDLSTIVLQEQLRRNPDEVVEIEEAMGFVGVKVTGGSTIPGYDPDAALI